MEDYGGGDSTGLDQTASGKITTGLTREDLSIVREDRDVLIRLAEKVAEIASSSTMKETRELWRKHNRLEKGRPLVFCDPENGWNEIITESQMACQGRLARRWEMDLRKEIFWGEEMGDDKPVEPFFDVPYTVSPDDWGMAVVYHRTHDAGSCVWDSPVQDYARDLKKLHSPRFDIDWETTGGCVDLAREIFGDVLTVRLKGTWWWSLGLTLPLAALRGLKNILCDFLLHPDELKQSLSIISRGIMDKLDYLEAEGLLSLNNDGTYVGSGGFGFTDDLPRQDGDEQVRCTDMWGFAESQETVGVSPDMYEEFIFPHEKPILERFGLNCYGCCEPLHNRWHVVRRHQNLRRVSCSPWIDVEKMAAFLEDKYIFSLKPNPAALGMPDIDEESIRQSLRRALDATRGCIVELVMKDNHTIGRRPENVSRWCAIAREEVEGMS